MQTPTSRNAPPGCAEGPLIARRGRARGAAREVAALLPNGVLLLRQSWRHILVLVSSPSNPASKVLVDAHKIHDTQIPTQGHAIYGDLLTQIMATPMQKSVWEDVITLRIQNHIVMVAHMRF